MWCRNILIVLVTLNAIAGQLPNKDICVHDYCKCVPAEHHSWTNVICNIPDGQSLHILEGTLPEGTVEISINGGQKFQLGINSLSRLKDPRLIRIFGTKQIVIKKHAAYATSIVNLFIKISDCDHLSFEDKAFINIKGPVTTNITDCNRVNIGREAFSWILDLSVTNVKDLTLHPGAFMLDDTATNVGEHGPGMKIQLKDLFAKEFPKQTFGSSAALVRLENVEVQNIDKEAFSANTFNVISIVNSIIHQFTGEAITQRTLINQLQFDGTTIHRVENKVLQSAVENLTIVNTRFEQIDEGAINITVATVIITGSNFTKISKKGLELLSCNKLRMENNLFKNLDPYAIVVTTLTWDELIFNKNAMYIAHYYSLSFIGQAFTKFSHKLKYQKNYYAETCHCNIGDWLARIFDIKNAEILTSESFCTIDELIARCFNKPDQNMIIDTFIDKVCNKDISLQCEPFKSKINGAKTEIKNPIFPEKGKDQESGLTARNVKVIGIMIVTIIGLVLLLTFISVIRCMKQRGYCYKLKDYLTPSSGPCSLICERLCCSSRGIDNAQSISHMSVNEYSERHRLNEPRVQDVVQETIIPESCTEAIVPVDDKTTQTLPEELTKELLESLREKLDDPECCVEAREMIEHLYELIKVEESCNNTPSPNLINTNENIYEVPFQNTAPRIGKNKKKMISVGTRVPSLERLTPVSPYNRQTALSHDYFEPKDLAVHLYAEIANIDKDRKRINNIMPDVVCEQAMPRGPYLRAVRDKSNEMSVSPKLSMKSTPKQLNSQQNSTIKSNKSTNSNSSITMLNRPLPAKPAAIDPGEGTSY